MGTLQEAKDETIVPIFVTRAEVEAMSHADLMDTLDARAKLANVTIRLLIKTRYGIDCGGDEMLNGGEAS